MKPLILFGRSPFISEIEPQIQQLISKYETAGLNHFASKYPVSYSFCLSEFIKPHSPEITKVFIHWQQRLQSEGIPLFLYGSRTPQIDLIYHCNMLVLSKLFFNTSVAINWALVNKYTDLYLIGVDHVESDKRFEHFDGIYDHRGQNMLPSAHQEFKQFVYTCAEYMNIYQCNPAVMADWKLPSCTVSSLI